MDKEASSSAASSSSSSSSSARTSELGALGAGMSSPSTPSNSYRISMKAFKRLGVNDTVSLDEGQGFMGQSLQSAGSPGRLSKIASKISSASTGLTSPKMSERKSSIIYVPQLVKDCCDYLRDIGMSEEGLFRISGSSEVVEALQDAYRKKGDNVGFDLDHKSIFETTGATAHEVATLLKMYLLNLPLPLIDYQSRADMLEILEDHKKKGSDVRQTAFDIVVRASQLDAQSKLTLEYILSFLDHVSRRQDENKMTGENLSRVFAPILLGDGASGASSPKKMTPEEILQTLPNLILITEILIANHQAFAV